MRKQTFRATNKFERVQSKLERATFKLERANFEREMQKTKTRKTSTGASADGPKERSETRTPPDSGDLRNPSSTGYLSTSHAV